jgi:hypothetical protein
MRTYSKGDSVLFEGCVWTVMAVGDPHAMMGPEYRQTSRVEDWYDLTPNWVLDSYLLLLAREGVEEWVQMEQGEISLGGEEDGLSALHPAFARAYDVIRAPNGVWWQVVLKRDAEVTTPSGVHLAAVGSSGLDEHVQAGHVFPIPGCPGWRRVQWGLVEAARALRQAEEAMAAAWADAHAHQHILEASFRMGGEYTRE